MKATIAGLSPSLTHTHTHLNWQGCGSAAQKRLSKHCPRQSRIAEAHRQTQRAVSDAGISHPPGKYKRLVMLYQPPWASDSLLILCYDNSDTCETTYMANFILRCKKKMADYFLKILLLLTGLSRLKLKNKQWNQFCKSSKSCWYFGTYY